MSSQISALISDNPKKGQIGLGNLGNTCYLNAVLQCLRHVPDLTVFFHKHSEGYIHKGDAKDAKLCSAYKELVEGLWSGTGPGYLRPAGFLHRFRETLRDTAFDHMIAPQPHDSHEALLFLLDQLHEGMKHPIQINIATSKDSPCYKALLAWKEQIAPEYSPIVDYFFGLMEVSVTCKGCQAVSCRYEPFNMLKVGFPEGRSVNLEDCINHEFKADEIDEYECNNCSPSPPKGSDAPKPKRHPASIMRRIWRLPQNLIVVLKRFNPNGSKCNTNFSADLTQKFEKWFAKESPEPSRTTDYTLQSVVDHHGSAQGGHYVAQVRSPITNEWHIYDDETVNKIQDGSKPFLGVMSYILFYRKV
jgi:ubiquitin carboxyl-terminal hydrolase 8